LEKDNKHDQQVVEESLAQFGTAQGKMGNRDNQKKVYVSKINYKEFGDFKFASLQSNGNLPFIWAETTLYGTPQSKYDWKNFKKTRFGKNDDLKTKMQNFAGDKVNIDAVLTKKVIDGKQSIFTELEKK